MTVEAARARTRGEERRRRERVGEEVGKTLAGETFCRRERASSGFMLEEGGGERRELCNSRDEAETVKYDSHYRHSVPMCLTHTTDTVYQCA